MPEPFKTLTAVAAPLPVANIDTDQIIPKQYLSTVTRTGLGRGLFHDMRYDAQDRPNPDFVLNKPTYQGAGVLITGPNFGCGSSREHAPWALSDFGIRCVVAESFADIFYNNCFNNGLLPAIVAKEDAEALAQEALGGNHKFIVDLATQTITAPSGRTAPFQIDPGRKQKLISGLDDIGVSLTREAAIAAHEERRRLMTPWLG
jgi:3-isopropylmalate/(R)-2-methylmalate dehydratase small subunit